MATGKAHADSFLKILEDERNGKDMGPIAVELSEDSRTLIVLFTLAIRVLLAALGVNISRVDVRPNRDGSDGYHDIAGDFVGVFDVVGEIKCRFQSLRDLSLIHI